METRVPWEQRGELGWARAFVRTLTLSIREPTRFYALAARDASPVIVVVAYGLVFELVVAAATFAYEKAIGEDELRATLARFGPELEKIMPRAPELLDRFVQASATGSLAIAPLRYLFEVFATAAVTWLGLRLTKNLRTSFGVLVRVFAYASWVRVFGLLGVTGDVLLSILATLLTLGLGGYYWLVAVRESQQIDTRRAVYASLVGGLVATATACVVGLPLLVGLVLWAVSKIELPAIAP